MMANKLLLTRKGKNLIVYAFRAGGRRKLAIEYKRNDFTSWSRSYWYLRIQIFGFVFMLSCDLAFA